MTLLRQIIYQFTIFQKYNNFLINKFINFYFINRVKLNINLFKTIVNDPTHPYNHFIIYTKYLLLFICK